MHPEELKWCTYIINCCLFTISNCALIEIWNSAGTMVKNSTKSIISNETIGTQTIFINITYFAKEPQIKTIEDLSELKGVVLQNIGHTSDIIFKNLPELSLIDLSGNEIRTITLKTFSETLVKIIYLDNNEISFIENGSFGLNITTLLLDCNQIQFFQPEWFQNPPRLEELSLAGNQIKALPKNSFKNFHSLTNIRLDFNQIFELGEGVFAGRTHFGFISLAYNNLTKLPPNIFKREPILIQGFDIAYNALKEVPKALLDQVRFRKPPFTSGNPWKCLWQCSLGSCGTNAVISHEGLCPEVSEKIAERYKSYFRETAPPSSRELYCPCMRKTGKKYDEMYKCFVLGRTELSKKMNKIKRLL